MRRVLLGLGLVLLVGVGGGIYWLHGNLDRLLRDALVEQGSALLGVPVRVDGLHVDPADGRGAIEGLVIGNPAGFKTPLLLKVQRVGLEIDLRSLLRDVVRIRRVEVVAPELTYEKGERQTNLEVLQARLAAQAGPAKRAAGPSAAGVGDKRLVVDDFVLRGARVEASAAFMDGKRVGVPLPDIHLKDIGKAQGGVPPAELGDAIVHAIRRRLEAVFTFESARQGLAHQLERAGAAIRGLFK